MLKGTINCNIKKIFFEIIIKTNSKCRRKKCRSFEFMLQTKGFNLLQFFKKSLIYGSYTIVYTVDYTVIFSLNYIIDYIVLYTIDYMVNFTINYIVDYTVNYTIDYTVDYTMNYMLELHRRVYDRLLHDGILYSRIYSRIHDKI